MKKFGIVSFLVIAIVCLGILLYANEPAPSQTMEENRTRFVHEPSLTLSLSHEEFFYNQTIYVSIYSNNPDAVIYFTTDGSSPEENGERFTQPLVFMAEEDVRCIVLKAVAVYNSERSFVLTHSYFIGYSIDERFNTYIFSLSTNDDYLFGHERGILTPGRIAADYLRRNPNTMRGLGHRPANYNQRGPEWERPIHVEAFTQSGERVIAQNAGIRVHGGATRRYPQNSLRLIARSEYERGVSRFNYNFFGDYYSACLFPALITDHQAFVLRNDGNDFLLGRIRTPLALKLAANAGFRTTSPQTPAVVFINGRPYGFAWINIRHNDHFLQNLYSAPQRAFDNVEGGNTGVVTDDARIRRDFERVLNYAEQGDMVGLNSVLDIENFLLYYAIQAYVANTDWPHNNIRIWRYTGDLSVPNLAPQLDGRWRFILYDIDRALGRNADNGAHHQSISRLIGASPIFNAVLHDTKYREIFANIICDLAAEHFSFYTISNLVQEINDATLHELAFSTRYGLIPGMSAEPNRNPYWEERGFDYAMVTADRQRVVTFAENRADNIFNEMRRLFGFTSMYRIISDGSAKINTLHGNEGRYFVENRVPVFPILADGQQFDHWLVNGERRDEEELIISFDDANDEGIVHVRLITR